MNMIIIFIDLTYKDGELVLHLNYYKIRLKCHSTQHHLARQHQHTIYISIYYFLKYEWTIMNDYQDSKHNHISYHTKRMFKLGSVIQSLSI